MTTFSDFLNACLQPIPHFKGLEILNDCEENQKLVQKLPDWAASRWNRRVTTVLMDGKEFPSFHDFVNFMSTEAYHILTRSSCLRITSTQKNLKGKQKKQSNCL